MLQKGEIGKDRRETGTIKRTRPRRQEGEKGVSRNRRRPLPAAHTLGRERERERERETERERESWAKTGGGRRQ